MAYIDSELAKRRQSLGKSVTAFNGTLSDDDLVDGLPADLAKHRQPAALGKLHEIDLGADATLKNIARTEAAKRRLEGGEPEVEETTGKVRLRRDGKPWRGRRKRNSDDVKRDKLVEEVMRESRRRACAITTPRAALLIFLQWRYTMSQKRTWLMTTKRPTTVLPSNLDESSWMPSLLVGRRQPKLRRRVQGPRLTKNPKGRSLEGVGALEQRCGSSKRRPRRNNFGKPSRHTTFES